MFSRILAFVGFVIFAVGIFALWEYIGSSYEGRKKEWFRSALILALGSLLYYGAFR